MMLMICCIDPEYNGPSGLHQDAADGISAGNGRVDLLPLAVVAWMALAVVTSWPCSSSPLRNGRFTRSGWGPRISARWGWILMETPVLITFLVLYGISDRKSNPVSLVLVTLWVMHYLHRSLVYPFRVHSSRPASLCP